MDDQGKPQLTSGVISDPAFNILDSHTKITKDLEGVSKKFLGATESLQILDQAHVNVGGEHLIPLLHSGEGFWGRNGSHERRRQESFLRSEKGPHRPAHPRGRGRKRRSGG